MMTDASKSWMTLLGTGTSMGVPMIGCDCAVCTSTDPRNTRTRTGVLVETIEGSFLIDTPPELREQLVQARIKMIEAVLFTHAHADHIMGLDDLRIFGFKSKKAVPLHCEEIVEKTLRRSFSYAFDEELAKTWHSKPKLRFERIGLDPIEVCGLKIQPLRLIHGRLPILGYRINDVAFCTDVSEIPPETWPLLEGLKFLVLDAIRYESHPTHFNVEQALEVIEKIRPKFAYLTHISHSLDHETTNSQLPENVELAYDGLRLPLS
ncbi:MBL fold metallo-hydrolase [Thalassoglobus sp. JC818]|uniref:MBL fold metallo-hydrolase n=1 Tax=Thalassoglobus sp. JC818 TaxID=3232136 RepID=UPI003459A380